MVRGIWKNISKGPPVAFVLAGLTSMIVAPPARAADYDIGSIHITQPWARATPKGASSGAAYMTITNNGQTQLRASAWFEIFCD
jgi:copper(I)-binding protein